MSQAMTPIETDYLVVGAGAIGMAFVDTLLTDTDAQIVMVDRHHRPGGHWNEAYPFVRLHKPAAAYCVNSLELGHGKKDTVGLNAGMYSLSSGAELLAYFDQVMQQRFLPSGRVRFLPMSQVVGAYEVESLLTGARQAVAVRRKVVDGTHSRMQVPSTTLPRYAVAPGVRCVPLNDLAKLSRPQAGYVVVGAGKTGMGACLWLLEQGVGPDQIRWVMPRDPWVQDRANVQSGDEFFMNTWGNLAQLRRIHGSVRLGHVTSIDSSQIHLEHGSIPLPPDTLVVDCSAVGIPSVEAVPVWSGDRITPQWLRTFGTVFSAALIAHVEATMGDDAEKNTLCTPMVPPTLATDWLRMLEVSMKNQQRWSRHPQLQQWLAESRLNSMFHSAGRLQAHETEKVAVIA